MKKCFKIVPNFSEFLFYSHDCMLNILNHFCIITMLNYKSMHLFLIAGIAPPDIRREVCARVERTKQTKDERHSLFGHTPAPANLKSRHLFLPNVQPMDFSAKTYGARTGEQDCARSHTSM